MQEFKRKHGMDLTSSPRALRRLRTACERAKISLSSGVTASIDLEHLFEGALAAAARAAAAPAAAAPAVAAAVPC